MARWSKTSTAVIALGDVDQDPRLQAKVAQSGAVKRFAMPLAGGTVDIVEHHPGQTLSGQAAWRPHWNECLSLTNTWSYA